MVHLYIYIYIDGYGGSSTDFLSNWGSVRGNVKLSTLQVLVPEYLMSF